MIRSAYGALCLACLILATSMPCFSQELTDTLPADPGASTSGSESGSSTSSSGDNTLDETAIEIEENSLKRIVLLAIGFAADADFTLKQKELIRESLIMRLNQTNPRYDLREHDALTPYDPALLDNITVLNGADVWVSVMVSGTMEKAVVTTRARDLHANTMLFELSFEVRVDSRFRNAFGGLWSPIAREMLLHIRTWQKHISLILEAQPGTAVVFDGAENKDEVLIVPEEGELVFSLPAPASYSYTSQREGHKIRTGTIFLETDTRTNIDPQAYFPLDFTIGVHRLVYPRVTIGIDLIPETLALETGLTFYNLAIMPSSPDDFPNNFFVDYHQITLEAGVRLWLSDPHAQWRFSLSAASEVNFMTSGISIINTLSPAALRLGVSADYSIFQELAFFAELAPRFSISADSAAALSALSGYITESATIWNLALELGPFILEPLVVQIGVRIRP